MRQTAPRRAPEKTAANATSTGAAFAAGEHLDLGITVSVYCAETEKLRAAAAAAPGFAPADSGFTEH
jgi:hypothetical protein